MQGGMSKKPPPTPPEGESCHDKGIFFAHYTLPSPQERGFYNSRCSTWISPLKNMPAVWRNLAGCSVV